MELERRNVLFEYPGSTEFAGDKAFQLIKLLSIHWPQVFKSTPCPCNLQRRVKTQVKSESELNSNSNHGRKKCMYFVWEKSLLKPHSKSHRRFRSVVHTKKNWTKSWIKLSEIKFWRFPVEKNCPTFEILIKESLKKCAVWSNGKKVTHSFWTPF